MSEIPRRGYILWLTQTIPECIQFIEEKREKRHFVNSGTLIECSEDIIAKINRTDDVLIKKGTHYFPKCVFPPGFASFEIDTTNPNIKCSYSKISNELETMIMTASGAYNSMYLDISFINHETNIYTSDGLYGHITPNAPLLFTLPNSGVSKHQYIHVPNEDKICGNMIRTQAADEIHSDSEFINLIKDKSPYILFSSPPCFDFTYKHENFDQIKELLARKYQYRINNVWPSPTLVEEIPVPEDIYKERYENSIKKINEAIDFLENLNLIKFMTQEFHED